jgi:hypothetical protein
MTETMNVGTDERRMSNGSHMGIGISCGCYHCGDIRLWRDRGDCFVDSAGSFYSLPGLLFGSFAYGEKASGDISLVPQTF